MNKTKRKIFEASMKLFAQKGYDATSIEEITATVGVAKGTLYYHFSSKEEIFNFLIEEGMKLLQNSIEIKISNKTNVIDKLKAVILIQIKILVKYENLISIILSQLWGNESRNITCKNCIVNYISVIESIIREGIDKKEIDSSIDAEMLATEIFGLTCSCLVYKIKTKKEIDMQKLYDECNSLVFGSIFK